MVEELSEDIMSGECWICCYMVGNVHLCKYWGFGSGMDVENSV